MVGGSYRSLFAGVDDREVWQLPGGKFVVSRSNGFLSTVRKALLNTVDESCICGSLL